MPTVQDAKPIASNRAGRTAADAIWIATAVLHRKNPGTQGFLVEEIVAEAVRQQLTHALEKTVYQHVLQHCVANRPPNPNRSRMLFEFADGYRRLYRDGDSYDNARKGSPTHPEWSILPAEYKDLQGWYEKEWNKSSEDPLLALAGTWVFGNADEYVSELRRGWEQ